MAAKTPPEIDLLSQQMRDLAKVINDHKSDMVCVLIVGSFLDQCLASLLRKYFIESKTADNLLSFKGDLGTFASRVNICYCLGLITKGMKQNLETIGEIRNLFGHTHLSLDFTNSEIEAFCEKLSFPKIHEVVGEDGTDPFTEVHGSRSRFETISFILANRLLLTGLATTHRERLTQGWE